MGAALNASSICLARGEEASTKCTSLAGSSAAAPLDRAATDSRPTNDVVVRLVSFMLVSFKAEGDSQRGYSSSGRLAGLFRRTRRTGAEPRVFCDRPKFGCRVSVLRMLLKWQVKIPYG